MVARLRDLRIGTKVALISFVVALGLATIVGIYVYTQIRLDASREAAGHALSNEQAATDAERWFFRTRIAEQGFIAAPSREAAEQVLLAADNSRGGLIRFSPPPASVDADAAATVRDWLAEYLVLFFDLAQASEQIGFTENDGLRGAVRLRAHAAEETLRGVNAPALIVALLQMRRHEKDFIERNDWHYVELMATEYGRFPASVAAARLSLPLQTTILNDVAAYHSEFERLAEAARQWPGLLNDLGRSASNLQERLENFRVRATALRIAADLQIETRGETVFWLTVATMAVMTSVILGLATAVGFDIALPIIRLTGTMTRLAAGDLQSRIDGTERRDEIGSMARALVVFRDAEHRAARAEQHLREVISSTPVGVTLVDPDNRIVFRNDYMNRMFPFPMEDGNPPTIMELVERTRVRNPRIISSDFDVKPGQAPTDALIDAYLNRPEGMVHFSLDGERHYVIRFKRLSTGELVVVTSDVSEQTQAKLEARMIEQRLQDAIDALPLSFALLNKDGIIELFNRNMAAEFSYLGDRLRVGRSIGDVMSDMWDVSDVLPDDSIGGRAEEWPRIKNDPQMKQDFIRRAAGRYIPGDPVAMDVARRGRVYRLQIVSLPDNNTVVRTSVDITDLRTKEEEVRRLGQSALAQRTTLLQQIIDSVPQAIAVIGRDGRVSLGNRSLTALVAHDRLPAPISELSVEQLILAIGLPVTIWSRVTSDSSEDVELMTTTLAGTPVRVRRLAFLGGDQLLTISDLTQQRQEEADRLGQRERILQAEKNQAVVTLAGSIAHDFNNLLAVILGFSTLAGERVKQTSAKLLEQTPQQIASDYVTISRAIDNVITSAERGRKIVESLTGLTRERRAETEALDLRDLVSSCEQVLRVLFPASVRFEIRLAEKACRVIANTTQIEQVITNLCINAVHAIGQKAGRVVLMVDAVSIDGGRAEGLRATGAGAQRLGTYMQTAPDGAVALFNGLLRKGRHIRLTVGDDGSGISESIAQKIFTPYFTTKEEGRGTGLGLPSVLEIVAAHNGGIHIRSRVGVGTTFMILLPEIEAEGVTTPAVALAVPITAPVTTAPEQPAAEEAEIRADIRILVVDDEDRLVELMATVLRVAGYEVEGFTDSRAAAERFAAAPDAFDLLITDQTMPDLSGRELVERLRSIRPELQAIICTGYSREISQTGDVPAGVRSILRKPYTPNDLLKVVRAALSPA